MHVALFVFKTQVSVSQIDYISGSMYIFSDNPFVQAGKAILAKHALIGFNTTCNDRVKYVMIGLIQIL